LNLQGLKGVWLRPLEAEDIPQVTEIEREAFSALWTAAPFKRELNNRNASYLVACCQQEPEASAQPADRDHPWSTAHALWDRLTRGFGRVNPREQGDATPGGFIAGYVATWFQGDEAHITEIAVRKNLQGNGLGELLLIGSVQASMERGSAVVTLEVRVSNFIAQRLYEKYGFKTVGRRKAYYHDNREDALIMTTSPIHSPEYRRMFQELQQAYRSRWREVVIDG